MATGVLVVGDVEIGKEEVCDLSDVTYEMLTLGKEIISSTGGVLSGVLVGRDAVQNASKMAPAETVFTQEDEGLSPPSIESAVAILKQIVESNDVAIVLIPGTNVWMGVGSALAGSLKVPFANFCTGYAAQNGSGVFKTQLFGGKIVADVRFPEGRGIVSVTPGSCQAQAGDSEATPTVEKLEISIAEPKVRFKQYLEPDASEVDITKEDILISIGRGIESEGNIELAQELADELGGVLAASRPVVDQGWLPRTRQVGKSGMNVKPSCYLALGISGAPEHYEGMKSSKLIISINTDAQAPIFNVSHYGACVDLFDIIEPLTEAVKKRKKAEV